MKPLLHRQEMPQCLGRKWQTLRVTSWLLLFTVISSVAPQGCQSDTCANGGTCDDTGERLACTCTDSWTGDFCTEDVDECALNVCQEDSVCENRNGSFKCLCYNFKRNFGWKGTYCKEDIDECANPAEDRCPESNADCANTAGSYSCVCRQGYQRLISDDLCKEVVTVPYNNSHTVRYWGDDQMFGPFYIPGGFIAGGNERVILYYISTNGYITFNTKFSRPYMPADLDDPRLASLLFVAPFWADIDIPRNSPTSGLYHVNLSLADTYSDNETKALFEQYRSEAGLNDFRPVFISVVTWSKVLPFYDADYVTGIQSATFQVVLATDGGQRLKGSVGWKWTWPDLNKFNVKAAHHLTLASPPTAYTGIRYTTKKEPLSAGDNNGVTLSRCVAWLHTNPPSSFFSPSHLNGDGSYNTRAPGAIPECPCLRAVVEADPLFGLLPLYDYCFITKVFLHPDRVKQKCCYDHGVLIEGEKARLPLFQDSEKSNSANIGSAQCCSSGVLSRNNPDFCRQFVDRFPPTHCRTSPYVPWGVVWGSGHVRTLDSAQYRQGDRHEYVLFKSAPNSQYSDVLPMEIQARFAVTLAAIAIKFNNNKVLQIQASEDELKVYVDRQEKTTAQIADLWEGCILELAETRVGILVILTNGVLIRMTPENDQIFFTMFVSTTLLALGDVSGLLVAGSIVEGGGFGDLNVEQQFTAAKKWRVTSRAASLFAYNLAGEGDGFDTHNVANFVPTNVPNTAYALMSAVSSAGLDSSVCDGNVACLQELVVTRDASKATTAKNNDEVVSRKENTLAPRPPVFVNAAKKLVVQLADGTFTHTVTVQPEVTQASVYPDVTVSVDAGVSLTTTFGTTGQAGQWEFTWTLGPEVRSLTSLTLTFTATSSVTSMSSHYKPAVVLCACQEARQCDYVAAEMMFRTYLIAIKNLFMANCRCGEGKAGRFCEHDVNPCDACYNVSNCNVNSQPRCSCDQGYVGDGVKCYEVDECLQSATCDQKCRNTIGSFICSCNDGFRLAQDGRTCNDVDECREGRKQCGVNEFCDNTVGGALCSCRPGSAGHGCGDKDTYKYGGSIRFLELPSVTNQSWSNDLLYRHTQDFSVRASFIEDIIEFLVEELRVEVAEVNVVDFKRIKNASSRKRNMIEAKYELITIRQQDVAFLQYGILAGFDGVCTSAECRLMKPGFPDAGFLYGVAKDDFGFQENYDLCTSERNNDCHQDSTVCVSANGTFTCSCHQGYEPWPLFDNACQDINECESGASLQQLCGNATNDTQCHNTDGSYFCQCPPSFQWSPDKSSCVEIILRDECSELAPCKNGATCENTQDGHACRCRDGWAGLDCGHNYISNSQNTSDFENFMATQDRYKKALIIVGSVLGVLNVIFISAFVALLYTRWRSYLINKTTPETVPAALDKAVTKAPWHKPRTSSPAQLDSTASQSPQHKPPSVTTSTVSISSTAISSSSFATSMASVPDSAESSVPDSASAGATTSSEHLNLATAASPDPAARV